MSVADADAAPGGLRVLLHDYGGYGFIAELARELARRGHQVHHVHASVLRNGKGDLSPAAGDPSSLSFSAVEAGSSLDRYAVADRLRLERAYAAELGRTVRAWGPDVVLSANTPLLVLCRLRRHLSGRVPLVNWLQDLHSVAMGDELVRRLGYGGHGGALLLRGVEARLLRSSAAVVGVSEDFLPLLTRWRVDRVSIVHNWAGLSAPAPRHNRFSAEHGLDDRVTLLYAGTLGLKHDPLQLVRLADGLGDRPDVAVVVVSEGLGRDWLERERRDRGLANLVLVDFQPPERVADVLGSGDVLLSMIRAEAGRFSVPSKVLSYLAAGRAQLGAIPSENLAARVLRTSGGGLVVEPADGEGWVASARRLVDNAPQRAELAWAGRAYAETHFNIGTITDRFEEVLVSVVRSTPPSSGPPWRPPSAGRRPWSLPAR